MKGIQKRTRYAPDVHAELMRRPQSKHNQLVNTGLRDFFEIIDADALLEEIEKANADRCLIQQGLLTSWGKEVDRQAIERMLRRQERFTRA